MLSLGNYWVLTDPIELWNQVRILSTLVNQNNPNKNNIKNQIKIIYKMLNFKKKVK